MTINEESYEQLLEESVSTISLLRLELQESNVIIRDQAQRIQTLTPRLELNSFDDAIEWEFEEEHTCRQCGAPVSALFEMYGGRCGQPCI